MYGVLKGQVLRAVGRVEKRQNVARAALFYYWNGGAERGIVCDVSPKGIFLQPLERAPESVQVGARLRVVFMAEVAGAERKVDCSAVVRWVGKHPHFKSPGLGLEFEEARPDLTPSEPI